MLDLNDIQAMIRLHGPERRKDKSKALMKLPDSVGSPIKGSSRSGSRRASLYNLARRVYGNLNPSEAAGDPLAEDEVMLIEGNFQT